MTIRRHLRTARLTSVLLGALCATSFAGTVTAQNENNPELLRRDQEEILRKAERLQDLMQRLLVRYQREGRKEQVALLEQGWREDD